MKKIFVGIPVSYMLMSVAIFCISISSGSLRNLNDLITLINSSLFLPGATIAGSIICTLGISLILWIPIWWIIGAVTIAIFPRLANTLNGTRSETIELPATTQQASPSQLAIAKYIKKAENSGLSDRAIVNRLVTSGWSEQEIERARIITNVEQQRTTENNNE